MQDKLIVKPFRQAAVLIVFIMGHHLAVCVFGPSTIHATQGTLALQELFQSLKTPKKLVLAGTSTEVFYGKSSNSLQELIAH